MNNQSSICERLVSNIQIQASQIKSEKEDDDLICPICSNVLWEPIGCSTCKLHTCLKCMQDWLNKGKRTCPISGCAVFQDEKPHPYFFKHLSNLQLDCENKEKGCQDSLIYEQYQKHIQRDCNYVEEKCPSEGCSVVVMRKDLNAHQKSCDYFIMKCVYCDMNFKRKEKKDHEEYICESFPVKCENEQCQEVVERVELKKHMLNCLYKLDVCNYCQQIYNQTQKHLHEQNCAERQMKCKGCKKIFKLLEFKEHLLTCDQIKTKCKMCLQEFPQLEFNNLHNKEACMEQIILSLQKENSNLKEQNKQLLDQQKLIETRMERIMSACFLNRNLNNEIAEWEQLIEECYQKIMSTMDQLQFLSHQKKKHDYDFKDVQLALKHFDFLACSSVLYQGWHKFHCSDCFNLVKKIQPIIQPFLTTIKNTQDQITRSKYQNMNINQN